MALLAVRLEVLHRLLKGVSTKHHHRVQCERELLLQLSRRCLRSSESGGVQGELRECG